MELNWHASSPSLFSLGSLGQSLQNIYLLEVITHLQSLKFVSLFLFPSLSVRKLFQQLVQFFLPLKMKENTSTLLSHSLPTARTNFTRGNPSHPLLVAVNCGENFQPSEGVRLFVDKAGTRLSFPGTTSDQQQKAAAEKSPNSKPGACLPLPVWILFSAYPTPISYCLQGKLYRPMRAFFLSVSASFSTTFCFCAAIRSFVFSLSLGSQKQSVTKHEHLRWPGLPHLQGEPLA